MKLLLPLFFISQTFAISVDNYAERFKSEIYPYYLNQSEVKEVFAKDNVKIHYRSFKRGHEKLIVVLGGRTEPIDKYAEVIFDHKDLPYDFLLIDSRGQGFSGRMLEDPDKGYVEHFEDYAHDIDLVFKLEKVRERYHEINVLAHSMGAGIALMYQIKNPGIFKKMVLSSPMIELLLDGKSEKVTLAQLMLMKMIGKKTSYIPGGGPGELNLPCEGNRVTSSCQRWEMARELERIHPELLAGASTINWVYEGIQLGRYVFKHHKKISETSILMFQAENEFFSRYDRQNKLCSAIKHCKKIFFKNAKHEVFQERDEIRDEVIKESKTFLLN